MTFEVRKPLLARMLDVFEPRRSKHASSLNSKDLTTALHIGNRLRAAEAVISSHEPISTAEGK